jgi:hypothetical protein
VQFGAVIGFDASVLHLVKRGDRVRRTRGLAR